MPVSRARQMSCQLNLPWRAHLLPEAPTHTMSSLDWNPLLSVYFQRSLSTVSLSSDPGACHFSRSRPPAVLYPAGLLWELDSTPGPL